MGMEGIGRNGSVVLLFVPSRDGGHAVGNPLCAIFRCGSNSGLINRVGVELTQAIPLSSPTNLRRPGLFGGVLEGARP